MHNDTNARTVLPPGRCFLYQNPKGLSPCSLLKETAEENQTCKILAILNDCKDLEEAKAKVEALLKK